MFRYSISGAIWARRKRSKIVKRKERERERKERERERERKERERERENGCSDQVN